MKSKSNSNIYYGIFDIELNKIIFNTKEKIVEFLPYSDMTMLAITKDKAYKICTYRGSSGCIDTCSNGYLLDVDGNSCGTNCPNGKLTFKNFYVTLEGVILELDDEKKDLYDDITQLFNGIEDLSVENTSLKRSLDRLRKNLNNRLETTSTVNTINEQMKD